MTGSEGGEDVELPFRHFGRTRAAEEMNAQRFGLHRVESYVCDLCLSAAGGECHVPGCAFWMQGAPVGSMLAWLRERRTDAC